MSNKWVEHVRAFAIKHKLPYKRAMSHPDCKNSYEKRGGALSMNDTILTSIAGVTLGSLAMYICFLPWFVRLLRRWQQTRQIAPELIQAGIGEHELRMIEEAVQVNHRPPGIPRAHARFIHRIEESAPEALATIVSSVVHNQVYPEEFYDLSSDGELSIHSV